MTRIDSKFIVINKDGSRFEGTNMTFDEIEKLIKEIVQENPQAVEKQYTKECTNTDCHKCVTGECPEPTMPEPKKEEEPKYEIDANEGIELDIFIKKLEERTKEFKKKVVDNGLGDVLMVKAQYNAMASALYSLRTYSAILYELFLIEENKLRK